MFRVFWPAILFAATAPVLVAATHSRTIPLAGSEIAGFAVDTGRLFVWGEDALAIDLRSGKRERIAQGRF